MPGVSGDENVSAPPRFAAFANEPGLVPSRREDGFAAPRSGRVLVDIRFFLVGRKEERRIVSARFPTPVQTGSGSTGTSQRLLGPRPERDRSLSEWPVGARAEPGERAGAGQAVPGLTRGIAIRGRTLRSAVPARRARRHPQPKPAVGRRALQSNTTVLFPYSKTRSSKCRRTARANTTFSRSRPLRIKSSIESRCEQRTTSCSMMGPSSRTALA